MKQFKIGVIANTFGLRGDLKVKVLTDSVKERYVLGENVKVNYNGELLTFTLDSIKEHKGMLLIRFKGMHDINLVEKYKGSYLVIEEQDLHQLEEGEVYHYQLIDSEVYDQHNTLIGKVSEVIQTGANDILRVIDSEGNSKLIPFVKSFVIDVNTDEKKISINVIDGLL